MKKSIILVLLLLSCNGLKEAKNTNYHCNENKQFKKHFFKSIKIVDDFMTVESKTEFNNIDEYERVFTQERINKFKLSLKFISKYAPVTFESMANYNCSYPFGIYESDKKGWIKWYEENKCKNIQFKP